MANSLGSKAFTRWGLGVMLALLLFIAAAAASSAGEPTEKPAREAPKYYVTGLVGGSWVTADAEGTTTTGVTIAGENTASAVFGGAALGTIIDLRAVDLRLELEGTGGRSFDFVHSSTAGSFATSAKVWTFQGNFWFEYPLRQLFPDTPVIRDLAPFGGGGVGLSGLTLATQGGAFTGRSETFAFAWQGGAGLSYQPLPWLSFEVRYQYADLGRPTIQIRDGGGETGSIKLDLGGNDVVGGIRFTFGEH